MTEYRDLSNAYFSGTISREDELCLFRWLREDTQHVTLWREWEQKWVDANAYCATTSVAWLRLQQKSSSHSTIIPMPMWRRPVVRWAAVACCAIFLIVFAIHNSHRPTIPESSVTTTIPLPTVTQSSSNVVYDTLPDGSKVVLNRGSQLSYSSDFGQADRQVLLSGEAYFDIEKDAEKPFIVRADGLKIRVTGTKFNVAAYDQNTQTTVTLLEGGVRISNPLFDADLLPNEQLVYTRSSNELVKRVCDSEAAIAWIDGNMDYDDIRLEELVLRLSLLYQQTISIEGDEIRNKSVHYFMDEQHSLDEVMDALGEVYKLHIAHNEQGYLVSD